MRRAYLICAAVLIATFATHTVAEEIIRQAQIDRFVAPVIKGRWAHCLVVGIITEKGRQIVGYGARSEADPTPPDAHTVFEIGSISKTFTSTLLARAVSRGEMKLDDPVSTLLPGVKLPHGKSGKEILLVHLSTHTSGLLRLPVNLRLLGNPANPYADYEEKDLYEYLATAGLMWEPGEKFSYSNLGVGLLGHALAKHAGLQYEQLLKQEITTPLSMSETVVTLSPEMTARLAQPFNADGSPEHTWDLNVLTAAGGIRSTTNDMLTYLAAEAGLTKTDLAPAIELTHKRQFTIDDKSDICLAWFQNKSSGIFSHNGQTGGYNSGAYFDPKHHIGVVVLSTSTAGYEDVVAARLARLLIGQKAEPPTPPQTIEMDEASLQKYVGEYRIDFTSKLTITRDGRQLRAKITLQSTANIYPETASKFFWKVVNAKLTFQTDADGKVTGVVIHQNGADTTATKVQ